MNNNSKLEVKNKKKDLKAFFIKAKKQKFLLYISIPLIVYIFIFSYFPLWGWIWSIFKFRPGRALSIADFVGLKYYFKIFGDATFWLALRNTLVISVLSLTAGTLSAIVFAIFLNELRNGIFKRFAQTVSYLPHFVSWVVVATLFIGMTKTIGVPGVIYKVLFNAGIIKENYNIMLQGNLYWFLITIIGIWKETGWAAIIYLAAMTGINSELYEAAYVDGAGRFKRIWNITLPGIKSTIIILLILNTGWILGTGFEQRLLFGNAGNFDYSEVLGSFIFRWGLGQREYSFAMAANVFQSIVGFFLVLGANYTAKKLNDTAVF